MFKRFFLPRGESLLSWGLKTMSEFSKNNILFYLFILIFVNMIEQSYLNIELFPQRYLPLSFSFSFLYFFGKHPKNWYKMVNNRCNSTFDNLDNLANFYSLCIFDQFDTFDNLNKFDNSLGIQKFLDLKKILDLKNPGI